MPEAAIDTKPAQSVVILTEREKVKKLLEKV